MEKKTILEKLMMIFEITKSSKLFIAVAAFLIFMIVIAITTNKNNVKRNKKIYALIYTVVIIALLVIYHNSLGKMFDYMMNNLFIVVYFPNIAVYLAAIIIANIIMLCTIFGKNQSKLLKVINIIVYTIIHYLLAIVLNIITKNSLDIFSQTSIYGNEEAHAIIELSSTIFFVWVIFLILYKLIRKYQTRNSEVVEEVVAKRIIVPSRNTKKIENEAYKKAQKELSKQKDLEKIELERKLQEANKKVKIAEEKVKVSEDIIKDAEVAIKTREEKIQFQSNKIKAQEEQYKKFQQQQIEVQHAQQAQLKELIKVQQEQINKAQEQKNKDKTDAIMKSLDNVLTLEDYKVLSVLLKEKQQRKRQQAEQKELKTIEQLKFAQLHEAYKSVR